MVYDNYVCEEQMNIFDFIGDGTKQLAIDKPIRLIELFSGYGSQMMALERMGANVESWKTSEWQVNVVNMYHAAHCPNDKTDYSKEIDPQDLPQILFDYGISANGKVPLTLKQIKSKGEKWQRNVYNDFRATRNLGSITNIKAKDLEINDTNKYCYMMFYSFPCQDISISGHMKGFSRDAWENGESTRSGMLWEVERLLRELIKLKEEDGQNHLPFILVMENVPQIASKPNEKDFTLWKDFLTEIGYTNNFSMLNARDFGIPQNRNRAFLVSVLGDFKYEFPKPINLRYVMRDILEKTVPDNNYLGSDRARTLLEQLEVKDIISDGTERNRQPLTFLSKTQDKSMSQTVSEQKNGELQNEIKTETELSNMPVKMNYKRIEDTIEVAKAICSRDYKGFGGGYQTQNGVVEVEIEDDTGK